MATKTPCAFDCSLRKNLLTIALAPSWEPLLCALPKKDHNILQPLVIEGYLETKYHGLLLLNCAAYPSLHTKVAFWDYLLQHQVIPMQIEAILDHFNIILFIFNNVKIVLR